MQIRTNLDSKRQRGHCITLEYLFCAKRNVLICKANFLNKIGSGCKMTLIDFAPCYKTQKLASVANSGGVVDLCVSRVGKSHNRYHIQFLGGIQIRLECILRTLQKGIICKEIAAGRARERQFREHQHAHTLAIRLLRQSDMCLGICFGVSHAHHGSGSGNFQKSIFHKS